MLSARHFALRLRCAILRWRGHVRLLPRFLLRRQDGVQCISFLARAEIYDTLVLDVFNQALQNLASQAGAGHLASTEKNGRLDLVTLIQEAQHVILLSLVIMVV